VSYKTQRNYEKERALGSLLLEKHAIKAFIFDSSIVQKKKRMCGGYYGELTSPKEESKLLIQGGGLRRQWGRLFGRLITTKEYLFKGY